MLRIRAEQIKAFEQSAIRDFENRMIAHLELFAPRHSKLLGEDGVRKVIQYGSEQTKGHTLTSERSVRIYIELMFMLGSHFDEDPQMPWAAEILGDQSLTDEVRRSNRLREKAWEYVRYAAPDLRDVDGGTRGLHFLQALHDIREAPDDVLSPADLPELIRQFLSRSSKLFPRKCEYVGEANRERLVRLGARAAQARGITTIRGVVLFVSMMFVLGAGFDRDPLLPWASAILDDPSVTSSGEKVDGLYSGAITNLKRWQSYQGGDRDVLSGIL